MPVKQRIRSNVTREDKRRGLIQGKPPHREHNAHKVLRKWPYYRGAILWLMALVSFLLSLLAFSFGVLEKDNLAVYSGIILIVFGVFLRLMFFLSAKGTTCPLCRANHYANSKSNKHKNAYKFFPFSYGSVAVITAVLRTCVRCMHCGVTFDLNKKVR